MIVKSRAIVLHQIKYAETSIIATLYTEALGRQTYLINGVRSSKSKQKMSCFQQLALLDLEAYHKSNRELQRLKEYRISYIHRSIPFDIGKGTVSIFLAEVLYKVLRSEECDSSLFDFIWQAVIYFDSMESGSSNFHLWFLLKMAAYMGFKIEDNASGTNRWFDMKEGRFVPVRPHFNDSPNLEESAHIAMINKMPVAQMHHYLLDGDTRSRLLDLIVRYYAIHFDAMGSINSLGILRELYH